MGGFLLIAGQREVSYVELETGRSYRWDLSRRRPTSVAAVS